jgi:hypothetical protein
VHLDELCDAVTAGDSSGCHGSVRATVRLGGRPPTQKWNPITLRTEIRISGRSRATGRNHPNLEPNHRRAGATSSGSRHLSHRVSCPSHPHAVVVRCSIFPPISSSPSVEVPLTDQLLSIPFSTFNGRC